MKSLECSRCSMNVYSPAWLVPYSGPGEMRWVVALLGAPGHSGAQPGNLTQGKEGACSQSNPPHLSCSQGRLPGRGSMSCAFIAEVSLS